MELLLSRRNPETHANNLFLWSISRNIHFLPTVQCPQPFSRSPRILSNRKEAIRTACMLAKKGDVILVAGKGHEDYQEIKGVKHHFDDKEVIRDIFGISQK